MKKRASRYHRLVSILNLCSELLEKTSHLLDNLLFEAPTDPALMRTRMVAHHRRGDLALSHDRLNDAQSEYQAAMDLAAILAQSQPHGALAQNEGGDSIFVPESLELVATGYTFTEGPAWDGARLTLTDLTSKNGTFLRIAGERALVHGDYVFMGQQLLRVEIV